MGRQEPWATIDSCNRFHPPSHEEPDDRDPEEIDYLMGREEPQT